MNTIASPARLCMRAFFVALFSNLALTSFPCLLILTGENHPEEGSTMEVKNERLTLDLAPHLLTLAEDHRRAQKREHAPYCRTASDRALKRVRHISDSSTRDEWTVCWRPYEQLWGHPAESGGVGMAPGGAQCRSQTPREGRLGVRRQWAEGAVDGAALRVQSRQHQPLGAGLAWKDDSSIPAHSECY